MLLWRWGSEAKGEGGWEERITSLSHLICRVLPTCLCPPKPQLLPASSLVLQLPSVSERALQETAVSFWAKEKPDSAGHLGDCMLTCHMASPKVVSLEGFLPDILTSESTQKSMTLCHLIFKFHGKPRQTWSRRFLMEQEIPPFSF